MREKLQHKIDFKTKPLGSLGQLEDIAMQIGLIQNSLNPEIRNPSLYVFAADHGLTDEKISPYPKDVTWQMVMNMVSGGAAISVFCRQNNIGMKVVDSGVDYDFPPGLPIISAKIGYGTRNMRKEPAMTIEECEQAMQKGADLVKTEADCECNTIGFGEVGIGNTSPSAILMHRLMNLPIEECTGAGSGFDEEGVRRKTAILKEISEKYDPKTPLETLATFGGFEIAMMVGAFLEGYRQNMVLLVDGFIASVSVLMAMQFEPGLKDNCIFCHNSDEQGHKKILSFLKVKPVLNLRMRVGEGTGCAVALPVIQSALTFLRDMASFEDAGVSNKD
jgi:nicotinate-nucleotide--dimethylbenzimidazole phosphoribosyltransferase